MSLKKLVNDKPLWDDFNEELSVRINQLHYSMEQQQEEKELFRLQGEIRGLRKLRQLRDKVNGDGRE